MTDIFWQILFKLNNNKFENCLKGGLIILLAMLWNSIILGKSGWNEVYSIECKYDVNPTFSNDLRIKKKKFYIQIFIWRYHSIKELN